MSPALKTVPPVHVGSGDPCPRCLALAEEDEIRAETVLPLNPIRVMNAQAQDGSGPCCPDCAAADLLTRMMVPEFVMARVAVGNDRQDQLRLPGAPMGLVSNGWVRPSAPGDLERHHRWLNEHGIWRADDNYDDRG